MANFIAAYNVLIVNEGGYRNVSWDLGGETYRGITRKYWPSWSGWVWIDNYKSHNGSIPAGRIFPDLEPAVQEFYRNNFWNKVHGDQIDNQQLANMVFDFTVQSGGGPREINEALGLTGSTITSNTLKLLNADPVDAFNKIKAQRIAYYTSLNKSGQISDNDIKGVLARVMRLATPGNIAIASTGLAVIGALLFFCS